MQSLIYAHRGSSGAYAEHTRAAYLQALADGADGVECDVHLSGDRQPVLIHDAAVDRTSNGTGPVASRAVEQLRKLDFSGWKQVPVPAAYGTPAEQFLTLAELLDLLTGAGRRISLAVEFKQPGPFGLDLEDTVLALLKARGWEPETSRLGLITVSFMSFSPESVRQLRRTVPAAFVCQLLADVDDAAIAEAAPLLPPGFDTAGMLNRALAEGEELVSTGEAGIAGPGVEYLRAHPERVAGWAAAGTTIRAWTVDDPADAQAAHRLGVQEFTTNYPRALRSVLAALGRADQAGNG
ncbi:glycerophosphodiester phosphodiesterase [Arthrobacter sp. Sa2BUA2]|uniref:Glycerophosphodiester phosphodiesterase n=1 Tax=Arthrobacter pullicola TaxID=2762224 RepID=A0ABR8YDI5_9MICC|nr:glycerophosphodiester phosphodiesterase family protein [Arthrobacter pullicola]MBD8042275.1 glycerophosphodiester phosphodiesterase [Arthrobacter pullicola]